MLCTAASGEIIGKENIINNQYYLRLQVGGKIRFSVAGTLLNGTTTLSPNTWYLATGTYDGATMKVYVNGVLVNETFFGAERVTGIFDLRTLMAQGKNVIAIYVPRVFAPGSSQYVNFPVLRSIRPRWPLPASAWSG